jgi:hypothetical protein
MYLGEVLLLGEALECLLMLFEGELTRKLGQEELVEAAMLFVIRIDRFLHV